MADLIVPRAQLFECASVLRDSLENEGVDLTTNPARVITLGKRAMDSVVPEFGYLFTRDVRVITDSAIQHHDGEINPFLDAEFQAHFSGINVSVVEKPEFIEGFGEIPNEKTDIVLVFTQHIVDPDPVDLGYSQKILVPMSDMDRISLVQPR